MEKKFIKSLIRAFQSLMEEAIDSEDMDSEELAELKIHGEDFFFPVKTLEAMEEYLGHKIDRMGLS